MASPAVVSSTVTTSPSSAGSEGACCQAQRRAAADERKRKRKESNRLSAQRSRARKQRQLGELTAQVAALRAQKGAMAAASHDAARRCAAVEAENAMLRARALELGARLESLTDLIQCMDAAAAAYNPSPFPGAMQHHQPPPRDATTMYSYY